MRKLFLIFIITSTTLIFNPCKSQNIPYCIDNEVLYDFLDELANKNIIQVNSFVKPYSRKQIATFLQLAKQNTALSRRQKNEVDFYLKDFNKELKSDNQFKKRFDIFYYADTVFKLSLNGIAGGRGYSNSNGFEYHRWNGAQFFGYIGKSIAFYGSLRDNYESKVLGGPEHLVQHRGGVYKLGTEKKDYSEARGGITYSWKSGSIGVVKDYITWGNNYNGSNILSGRSPSFAQIKFNIKPIKWLELNYFHGWLASEVVDSSASYNLYNDIRRVYSNKYIAANVITIQPWQQLQFSLGNSIIYSDGDLNPAFLIPFLFYKSVDHSNNGSRNSAGHNTQMFFDISSRQIKNVHLYSSVFIDEISISNFFDKKEHSNFISFKIGTRITDIIPNASFTLEYTRSNPFTYTHFIPSLTFESNHYSLGHYLKDNADDLFLSIRYKPLRGLDIQLSYNYIRKGRDNQKMLEESDEIENLWGDERKGYSFMNENRFKRSSVKCKVMYQIINDAFLFTEIERYDLSGKDAEVYSPTPYFNDNKMIVFGANFGF